MTHYIPFFRPIQQCARRSEESDSDSGSDSQRKESFLIYFFYASMPKQYPFSLTFSMHH
jgi:hypothetical protein